MRLLHRVASIPQRGGDASEDSAHYRELFENAGDLIYTTDLAGNFTSINPAGERLTGYTREELLASNIGQIVAAESLGTILQMMDHAVKGVSPTTYELEVLAKDGRQVPMEVSTRLIAQGGEVVGVHGIGRDISMRRRANRKFQQRTAHLEALNAIVAAADAAPDLPLLLTVVIDRVLEALTLGMGGIWAGDHHVVRGLSPEIGATVVAAVQSSQPKTAATASVADWQALSADGVHPQAEQWIHIGIRASLTVPIMAEGRCIGALILASPYSRPWTWEEVALAEAVGQQVAATAEGLRIFQESQQHAGLMKRLVALSDTLNRPAIVTDIAAAIGQAALSLSGATGGAVYLRGPEGAVTCPWAKGLPADSAIPDRVPEGSPVLFPDVLALAPDDEIRLLATRQGFRALGVWPLTYEGREIARVLCCYDDSHAWSKPEKEVFQTFTWQAASALENARLYEVQVERARELEALHHNLEESYIQMVLALARAMDARDAYTGDHSDRLATLADGVVRALDLPDDEAKDIRWAALLHDIGKIGSPDGILGKPGPLTEDEWMIMRRHPVVGAEILRPVERMRGVAKIVRHHQEKWDGSGYPDGLRGKAIPLGARILAVVDAYSAIVDERPYKKPGTQDEAEAEIRRCAGVQFDPEIVEIFCQTLSGGRQVSGAVLPRR
ncbi:MAG TPA: HD domain-containing phosphohydrolase [bacterium]|nr:HD domain-containing phosphohydrolase [bacterium]